MLWYFLNNVLILYPTPQFQYHYFCAKFLLLTAPKQTPRYRVSNSGTDKTRFAIRPLAFWRQVFLPCVGQQSVLPTPIICAIFMLLSPFSKDDASSRCV
jgi:hypothetical protein